MKPFIFFAALFFPVLLFAQGPGGKRGAEIESFKVAYLTQKLDLSPEDAKVFWPIYNEWQKEQETLRKERFQKMISFRKIADIDELSDAQIQSLITSEFALKQRELNLEKKYYARLKANLPIRVIGKFYRAQETFKRELLTRFREGKMNN
ncbi:hypothetical protein C7T94_15925 [Pedobacter yulinensis]|uniref:Sensor of ECF-type sigma factor n=1 Tax=Pedobacter yulinensis TaxID=2126353 RepID=A0A2T3HIL0_9SPHI|nr:hypothetical protein [Pedobacter yulinensis]PST82279.1 hypothetical protein C7T94_15925 [Pedobacter yulinensis]